MGLGSERKAGLVRRRPHESEKPLDLSIKRLILEATRPTERDHEPIVSVCQLVFSVLWICRFPSIAQRRTAVSTSHDSTGHEASSQDVPRFCDDGGPLQCILR